MVIKMKIKALVAVRSGSQRVQNKNIRSFAGSSLLEIKLEQLLDIKSLDGVVVNSNDEAMLRIAEKMGCETVRREAYYASNEVSMSEVYQNMAENFSGDIIVYANVTNPLLKSYTIEKGIETYLMKSEDYDSLNSAHLIKEFLFKDGHPMNYKLEQQPRSQDLPDIYALNFALNIIEKDNMIACKNVVGRKPYIWGIDEVEATDIDNPIDFTFSEYVYIHFDEYKGERRNPAYRFVIWGFGERGKRFVRTCPRKHIAAIIDKNPQTAAECADIPFITYEDYKKDYRDYDILISVYDNQEIRNELEQDGIFTYHSLDECPPEMAGFWEGGWIDKLPIEMEPEKDYVIYGLNAYSLLLREYLINTYGLGAIDIIIEDGNDNRDQAFLKKYAFLTKRKVREGEAVLWATRFVNDRFIKGNCLEVFDFMGKIKDYEHPELMKYKNKHKGESCFIVATGPSLRVSDLDILKKNNCICFSVNRIYLSFEETDWRPDYFVVTDEKIIREYAEEIRQCEIKVKFIRDCGGQTLVKNSGKGNLQVFHQRMLNCCPDIPKFSQDLTKGIYTGGTVTYACFQIAVYMGFKKIFLIGADHNYTDNLTDTENHFHKEYSKNMVKPNHYFKEEAELAYQSARKYAEQQGVEIYNATRGGKLEVFERVDFDALFLGGGQNELRKILFISEVCAAIQKLHNAAEAGYMFRNRIRVSKEVTVW